MSNDKTEVIPTVAPVPTRRSILHPASSPSAPAQLFAGWRDRALTEELPAVGRPAPSRRERTASTSAGTAFPRVSTPAEPTRGREALRTAPTGTKVPLPQSRLSRHLRAALAAIALAAAVLIPMQLFALQGISSARQAALEQAARRDAAQADVRSDIQAAWVTERTGAAYDRADPTSSPLDLPRCTTSPDTPLPCLATISPDSRRAVVLEEDASLTAVVRR